MDHLKTMVGQTADTNENLSRNNLTSQRKEAPGGNWQNEYQPERHEQVSDSDLNFQTSAGADERQSSPENASENCPLLGTPSSNNSTVPFQDCDRDFEPSQNRVPKDEDDCVGTKADAFLSPCGDVLQNVVYGMNNNNNNPVPTAKMIPFDTGCRGPFKTMSSSPTASDASSFVPLLRNCMQSNLATPSMSKRGKKKKQESGIINVLAAQTLKIASINGLGELDKLENDLEEEIRYENRSPAKTKFGRLRQEGHHQLHSKFVLFVVVALNIIDTIIVMAELILDFHYVSQLIITKQDMIDDFRNNLFKEYSPLLNKYKDEKDYKIFQLVLDSYISFAPHLVKYPPLNLSDIAGQCVDYVTSAAEHNNQSFSNYVTSVSQSSWSADQPLSRCFPGIADIMRPGDDNYTFTSKYVMTQFDKVDYTLINVAHKLHYISISILAVLVIIIILKGICSGKRFFKSRMQVFDGIVIIISFTVDLVFIEGVTIFQMDEFVIILTFLFPWRIIRVLNSLIVAVLDKQRLNLKIIYTQKKKITRNLSEVNNKVEVLQRQIQVLQGLCSSRGINDGDVRKILGTEKRDKKGGHHGGGGLASMMALGKLAFQAADALAPMPNDYGGKNRTSSTPTTPVLLSPFAFAGSPLMGSTDSKSTPPSSTPTTPEANGHSNQKKITSSETKTPNGLGESFNSKAAISTTESKDIEESLKAFEEENPGKVANGVPRMPQDNIRKNHSMDSDSIGTEFEDLKDQEDDKDGDGGSITTSQVTLHSSPGALEPSKSSDSESASPDNVAIETEDPNHHQTTTTTARSSPVSQQDVGSAPEDGHVNSTNASSRM